MSTSPHQDQLAAIEAALDTLRPYLETDGGNIEVVEYTSDKVVKVRLLGNCETCPMSFMTMKAGVEETLKKVVPGLKGVVAVNVPEESLS
jgi:Fe-S cluster biogenesis protein NfuA